VTAAIAATGGTCQGAQRSWLPRRQPIGARVSFSRYKDVRAGTHQFFEYRATADEDVNVKAGLVPAGTPVARIPALLRSSGSLLAYRKRPTGVVALPRRGRCVLAVLLTAKMNAQRVALFRSPPFRVGRALRQPPEIRVRS
jgi:hypothetical protein